MQKGKVGTLLARSGGQKAEEGISQDMPGKPQEMKTQVRNFNLQQALLSKAQQTAKLSCRKGAPARFGGTARP